MKNATLFLALITLLFSSSVFGQTSPAGASIKAGVAIPMGDFADAASVGAGGEGTFEYLISPNLGLIAVIGYYSFGAKEEIPGIESKFTTVPFLVGGRYYFSQATLSPYAGAELGLHYMVAKVTSDTPLGELSTEESETKFGFAPVLGLLYRMPPNLSFDLSAKYNYIASDPSTTYISIIAGAQVAF